MSPLANAFFNSLLHPFDAADRAARKLLDAKTVESDATAARIAAEQELIRLVGLRTEGTTTCKTDFFKISTTGKLNRALNVDALTALIPNIPENVLKRLIRYKPELNLTELRNIEANDPLLYILLSSALTVTPAKPSVSVDTLD